MLLAESEGDLQRVVNAFFSVCKRRKHKVNAGKNRVRLPAVASCRIMLRSEKMEEVSLNILEQCYVSMEGMEGEIRERMVKGRSVVGSLTGVMKGRNVSMDVKRGLRNSILLILTNSIT